MKHIVGKTISKVRTYLLGMNARIYQITNDLNSKIYVGQTYKSIEERFARHRQEAKWKNTKKMPIVLAIKKYGEEHFFISLLEELPDGIPQAGVDAKEIEWGLKLMALSPMGYNLKLGSGRGILSEETKRKISISNTGKTVSPETIRRLSISHKGYKMKDETKRKLSKRWKGIAPCQLAKKRSIEASQKTYTLISPSGIETKITNMAKFCRENGYDKSNMCELVNGHKLSYRGWKIK